MKIVTIEVHVELWAYPEGTARVALTTKLPSVKRSSVEKFLVLEDTFDSEFDAAVRASADKIKQAVKAAIPIG